MAIPTKVYSERAVKLLDSQAVIDTLLEELEATQKQLSNESNIMHEKNKNYVKMEQPQSKVKTEHKITKSMFHGTSLVASSSASPLVLDSSVLSDNSEGSFYDC